MNSYKPILVIVLLLLNGCSDPNTEPKTAIPMSDRAALIESSMNFDLENVRPFLVRLQPHIESGFTDADVGRLADFVAETPVEQERETTLTVVANGSETPLVFRVFMDDIDAPDLYFFTSAELAAKIDSEYEAMCEELGI